jgi:hypothetical protein
MMGDCLKLERADRVPPKSSSPTLSTPTASPFFRRFLPSAVALAVVCDVLLAGGCSAPQSVDRAYTEDGGGPIAVPEVDGGTSVRAPAPPTSCGNGYLDPGEQCDLGPLNRVDAYGSGQCFSNCTTAPSCGDGAKNGPEECDDGPLNAETDGRYGTEGQCNTLCKKITLFCGDQQVTPPELCDRGLENDDGVYGPDLCTKSCLPAPYCGDAKPDMREECDEGPLNTLSDKTWSLQGGGCNMLCRKIVHRCGDGMMDAPDEQCDAGMMNTTSDMVYGTGPACNRVCKKVSYCGDGFRDAVEHCDMGTRNTNNDKVWGIMPGGCNRACNIIYRYCGDGYLEVGDEQCDLGPGRNTGGPGGCDARCRLVGS